MADADSEQAVSFGEIFSGQKSAPSNDFESSLLDYSQPTYTANFQNLQGHQRTWLECVSQDKVGR